MFDQCKQMTTDNETHTIGRRCWSAHSTRPPSIKTAKEKSKSNAMRNQNRERRRERGTWRKRWRIFLWAVRKSRPKLRAKRGEFSSSRRFWRVCEPRTIGVQGIYWRRRLSTCWTRSKRREGGVETGRGSQRPACAPFCTRRVGEEDEPSADETLRLRGKAACPRAHTHTHRRHTVRRRHKRKRAQADWYQLKHLTKTKRTKNKI